MNDAQIAFMAGWTGPTNEAYFEGLAALAEPNGQSGPAMPADPPDHIQVGRPELAAVLDDVMGFITSYIVLRDEQAVAVTLWIAHTFVYDRADQSPILGVTSAEKRSGKSRLLDIVEYTCAKPWRAIRPSEAVVFRKIDRDHPTVLVDEGDTLWKDRNGQFEGLRAIFNAGNRRGSPIPRVVGKNMVLTDFDIYCPKAIAGIGGLPATVLDRSVLIRMIRRSQGESVGRLREREARPAGQQIRSQLADALADVADLTVHPLPEELDDRAADGWEVMLAIADAAGGRWSDLARRSAVLLNADRADADDDGDSLSIRLLRDLHGIFGAAEAMLTRDIVEALIQLEDSPWRELAPHAKPVNGDRLRRLLAPFGVRPQPLRLPGEKQARGYVRAGKLEDSWARYLLMTSEQVSHPSQASQTPRAERAEKPTPVTPVTPVTPLQGSTPDDELDWGSFTFVTGRTNPR